MEHERSQLSGRGVDIQTHAKLAESSMWPRSQFRGDDFYTSQARGVDVMGRDNFKI